MSVEKKIKAKSGYGMLAIVAVLLVVIVGLFIWSVAGMASTPDGMDAPAVYGWGLGASIFAFCLWFIPLSGFFSLQPGQARVCILFGKYVGTVRDEGFFWANPFYSKSMGSSAGIGEMLELEMSDSKAAKAAAQKAAKGNPTTISTRVRTLNGERLKVNDKMGNPIEIANVVVWHVADTAKALFDVDDYPQDGKKFSVPPPSGQCPSVLWRPSPPHHILFDNSLHCENRALLHTPPPIAPPSSSRQEQSYS